MALRPRLTAGLPLSGRGSRSLLQDQFNQRAIGPHRAGLSSSGRNCVFQREIELAGLTAALDGTSESDGARREDCRFLAVQLRMVSVAV